MSIMDTHVKIKFVHLGYGAFVRFGERLRMNKIRQIREAKGLSLEKVALACSPQTTAKQIQRLERGERRLTTDWIERLAKALGVRPAEIVPSLSNDGIMQKVHQLNKDHLKTVEDLIDAYLAKQEQDR